MRKADKKLGSEKNPNLAFKNDVLEVARYVIDYSTKNHCGISNLKLQKILYFTQAYFLMKYDISCFGDEIEAWDIGPVIPVVYNQYKQYGGNHIPTVKMSDKYFLEKTNDIRFVVDMFKDFSAADLTKLTQSQAPWSNAWGKQKYIYKKDIKNYFIR